MGRTMNARRIALVKAREKGDRQGKIEVHFNADVTRFSISRALREAKWSKKCTQNFARERNPNLRDENGDGR
jgi:hypothetical protein